MISSSQRAKLRALANEMETILQIGKGGVSPNLIKQADDALSARELIKGRVLESAGMTSREAAAKLADATGSEPVQVIGTRFVLYRENPKDKKIILD
jgi:RNA-binding protein